MVQAARSGVQNIPEGSQASGTSKKTELKLTNVARASLEELRLDYEDYLRQRGLQKWPPEHPALMRFKAMRCTMLGQFQAWVKGEIDADQHGLTRTYTDSKASTRDASVSVCVSPCQSVKTTSGELAANGVLSLLNLCRYLLGRQIAAQADSFEREEGFTERLYRVRKTRRDFRKPNASF